MSTPLNALVARERSADVARSARERAEARTPLRAVPQGAVALRLAGAEDAEDVRVLAELDEAPEPAGQVLLALVDGQAVAALSLDDERIVANPFVATSDAVALLRIRARHLGGKAPRRSWRRLRPRFA
jgi:hypothetical protein